MNLMMSILSLVAFVIKKTNMMVILFAFHLTENDKRSKLQKFIEIIQLINDKYVNPIILGNMDLNLEPKTNMFKYLR